MKQITLTNSIMIFLPFGIFSVYFCDDVTISRDYKKDCRASAESCVFSLKSSEWVLCMCVCLCPSAVPVSVRAGPRFVCGRPRQTAPGHPGRRAGQGCRQGTAGRTQRPKTFAESTEPFFPPRSCNLNTCEPVAFKLPVNVVRIPGVLTRRNLGVEFCRKETFIYLFFSPLH